VIEFLRWLLSLLFGSESGAEELPEPELPEEEDTEEDEKSPPVIEPPPEREVVVSEPKRVWDPIEQVYVKQNKQGQSETKYRWYNGWKTPPAVIVVHYSAGYDVKGCKDALTNRGLSVHASIERDGVIYDHVTDANRGIHAGYGRWCGLGSMNSAALGFEIINLGPMDGLYDPSESSPYRVYDPAKYNQAEFPLDPAGRTWYRDESYTDYDGVKQTTRVLSRVEFDSYADHRPDYKGKVWSVYPDEQLDSVFWLVWSWVEKYDILLENVVGHEHVTPHRKQDPGPAFPWQDLEEYLREKAQADKPELLDFAHKSELRIKAVQSHCARMGMLEGSIDGDWGPMTQRSVDAVIAEYGDDYDFEAVEASKENSLELCNVFRRVPGFDPGRS
jgi:N-acetylmuramoyl-L-alanine amidase